MFSITTFMTLRGQNVGSGGGAEQTARGARGQGSTNGGADDAAAVADVAAADDGVDDTADELAAAGPAHA